ncbi:hypothetical protein ASD04_14845 [Devosia sp. Root436]|uniref:hypothetical protein n=1 Tax=Devosia sp. Root436 TaxID=1736537 RepID=UPI0006F9F241|nr:hypothetical protein [Devosia sp. Root436]KQX35316.1 hypothetical protein ASD04_14845 [Devosia sp. Root436]
MNLHVPPYALIDRPLWTPDTVKEALVDAFATIERTTPRVGPTRAVQQIFRGKNPEEVALIRLLNDDQLAFLRAGAKQRPARVTPQDISQAEAVVLGTDEHPAWLATLDDEHRPKLVLWVLHEVGKDLGIRQKTLRQRCEQLRWAKRSFYRHVDSAAGKIAVRLNRDGIEAWLEPRR